MVQLVPGALLHLMEKDWDTFLDAFNEVVQQRQTLDNAITEIHTAVVELEADQSLHKIKEILNGKSISDSLSWM